MRSFFVHPACDHETLEAHKFFLIYHGKGGYSLDSLGLLSFGELQSHVKRLYDQLKQEEQSHKDAMQKAKSRSR